MKTLLFLFCITCFISPNTSVIAQETTNVLEEIPFDYLTRHAIYDYSERNLNNTDTIPSFETQENKLKITGTIFQSDGVTPASNVILYIEQPDEDGSYDLKTENDKRYVNHRAWIKTDADGQYTFFTFIPGSYQHSREFRHIHPVIKEAGKSEYSVDTFLFDDDPYLTKACRKKLARQNYRGILNLLKKDKMYVTTHNIILPQSIAESIK